MFVIEYDAHDGIVVPDGKISEFVQTRIAEYHALPNTDNGHRPVNRVFCGSICLLRAFFHAIEVNQLTMQDTCIVMANRSVYFLFLKNLFSQQKRLHVDDLRVIFENEHSSFACPL